MFGDMNENQIKGAIEALLFVSNEPVNAITLAEMLECDTSIVIEALTEISDAFERDNRGIQLREVAGGWRLFTHPTYHDLIEKFVLSWDTRKLSSAAIETLAIIAYTQPSTRAQVASLRGVNSDSAISSLVEKGFIKEAGNADSPGNPTLYRTTNAFLERFGLRSLKDLPPIEDFAPDEETRNLIKSRLSSSGTNIVIDDAENIDISEDILENVTNITIGDSMPFDVVEKIDFDELNFDVADE